jgi:branched-chain amino acid transport system substrate-binding protein
MKSKAGITLIVALALSALAVAAAAAKTARGTGPSAPSTAQTATASNLCKTAGIAFAGPVTGPAAFLGNDQVHWVNQFLTRWNAGKSVPGVPAGLKRVKLKLALIGDSQLNPQVSATVAAQVTSNKSILAMVGFAGSNENLGGGPVLDRAGVPYVSGSATADALTKTLKGFFRVVPNNSKQAAVGVAYIIKNLPLKKGDQVMVLDDAEAYGIGIANAAQKLLAASGMKVSRESVPESTSSATADFTAIAQKAVAEHAKLVYAPTQVATDSQLLTQQLKTAGFTGGFMATDGSLSPTEFKFPGAYVSFFGPDLTRVAAAKPYLAAYTKKYGKAAASDPFGAPSFVAAQMIAIAISRSCAHGKTSRAAVTRALKAVKLPASILGHAIAFDNAGDVRKGPARGVTVFKIQSNGTYKLVFTG